MDETQKRKLGAKEFIEKNRNLGLGVVFILIFIFAIYLSLLFFYSREKNNNLPDGVLTNNNQNQFIDNLLPSFSETDTPKSELDNEFLANFKKDSNVFLDEEGKPDSGEAGDTSKITKIESEPVLNYVVFDKPVSIKTFIQKKPKLCTEKLEIVLKKETKSNAVKSFQNMLRSIDDYADTPDTEILDEKTREKIFAFQTRYGAILYKNKTDKNPTRVIDKETTHFLNLLCGLEKENPADFVQIPTLRYVIKATGDIFDYNTENKQKTKIDSKLASSTEEVIFSPRGDFAIFRKETSQGIESKFYVLRTKNTILLENNITTLNFNSNNVLVYGTPGKNGMTIKSYDYSKNSVTSLAILPLNEWNLLWMDDRTLSIYNKPSAFAEGIYMILDTTTRKLSKVAGPLKGMAVQNTNIPDLSIVSTGSSGDIKTLLLNNKTKNMGDFGIKTFAEKCSHTIFANGIFCAVPKNLSTNFVYPDDWYKNKIRNEDIIIYKTISGTTTKIISYLENRPISVINLEVNKSGIFFLDENTLNLYSLEP